jgi:hypothetical protein
MVAIPMEEPSITARLMNRRRAASVDVTLLALTQFDRGNRYGELTRGQSSLSETQPMMGHGRDPATIAADAVRQRLVSVEAACRTIGATTGKFRDPDLVYDQLTNCLQVLERCQRTMRLANLVRP